VPNIAEEENAEMIDRTSNSGGATPRVPLTPEEKAARAASAKADAEAKAAARRSAMQYLEPGNAVEAAEQIKRLNEALSREQARLSNRIDIGEARANIKIIKDSLIRAKEAGAKFGLK
jgi:hypothetical protein